MAPVSKVSHTCLLVSALSSRMALEPPLRMACLGRKSASDTVVATANTATITKHARQPMAWPVQLISGTPMVQATVRPNIIMPTACARLAGGTNDAATSAPTPK